jgi:DNA-directed RNA polymerase subunit M/transcription elongation factor TFIIS
MLVSKPCPNCGAKLHIRPDTERITCRACGAEYAVLSRTGSPVLMPVLVSEAREVGLSVESARATAKRLRHEIGLLQQLMKHGEAESARGLKSRYTLAKLGGSLLAIGLASRYLVRLQSPLVLVVALVGAVILVAAISSIKGLTDDARSARRLRQEVIEAKEADLERLRDVTGPDE